MSIAHHIKTALYYLGRASSHQIVMLCEWESDSYQSILSHVPMLFEYEEDGILYFQNADDFIPTKEQSEYFWRQTVILDEHMGLVTSQTKKGKRLSLVIQRKIINRRKLKDVVHEKAASEICGMGDSFL